MSPVRSTFLLLIFTVSSPPTTSQGLDSENRVCVQDYLPQPGVTDDFLRRWDGWANYTWIEHNSSCLPHCGYNRTIQTTHYCFATANNGLTLRVRDDWCTCAGLPKPLTTTKPCGLNPSDPCDCEHVPQLVHSHFPECTDPCGKSRRSVRCVRYDRTCRQLGPDLPHSNCTANEDLLRTERDCGQEVAVTCSRYFWARPNIWKPNDRILTRSYCNTPKLGVSDISCVMSLFPSSTNITLSLVDDFVYCEIFGRLTARERQWLEEQSQDSDIYEVYQCSCLVAPEDGAVSLDGVTVDSRAHFTCSKGTLLKGSITLICQYDGLWSDDPPACLGNLTIFILRDEALLFPPERLTSEAVEGFADNLAILAIGRVLTPDELIASIVILDRLVTLLEDALEYERTLNISDTFINVFIEVAGILLDSRNTDSWLAANISNGAPFFLEIMERFGRVISFERHRNYKSGSPITYSSQNVALDITVVTWSALTIVGDITFPENPLEESKEPSYGVIRMTSSFLSVFAKRGNDVLMSFLSLKKLKDYMPSNETSFNPSQTVDDQRKNSGNIPSAVILSASLVVAQSNSPFNRNYSSQMFPEAVYINYTFQPGLIDKEATCAFWQFSNDSTCGRWSTTGLSTVKPTADNIVCLSTHLTSFSVLTAIDSDASKDDALSYITYIGCGISLACLLLTLICLVYCRSHLLFERTFININFVIALMLALIFFLAGIDQSGNRKLCKAMTVIMHYLFLSVFCWMLCEGLLLYRLVVRVFNSGKRYTKTYIAIGWGLPAVIVAVSIGLRHDEYGAYEYCFLTRDKGLIYAFIGPMSAILLINLIVFAMVLKTVIFGRGESAISNNSNKSAIRSGVRAMAVLMPVLGLTWTFGVFAVDTLSFAMACIFTVLNSFQGLFVFLFHCLLSEQVRKALKKKRKQAHRRKTVGKIPVSPSTKVSSNPLQSNEKCQTSVKSSNVKALPKGSRDDSLSTTTV